MMIIPLSSIKLKVNFTEFHFHQKKSNMFIRIIAAIDSWFFFQIWFCHVLLKWYCNSLLLLSRLTRVTKKNCIKRCSESETESATEIVEKWVGSGWLLGWPERLGYWILENSFMSWLKAQWKTQSDYVYCPVVWKLLHHVAMISWLPATQFWLICSVNKRFILMWVYHLSQNEWLFWKQCLYKWS